MNPTKKTARIAGLLYLIVVLAGFFNLIYVPSQLIVWTDADATFQNVVNSETLLRFGIVAGIICYTAFLFLPLVLYKLLGHINKTYAVAMVALALVSVPISLYNLINKINVLTLIGKEEYLKAFDPEQLKAQVLLSLNFYENGITIASFFWGLWLFPFGYLVFKSGLIPKIFGILLMLGCMGYMINFFGGFLIPNYNALGISGYVSMPSGLGEIGTCLWLVTVGVRTKSLQESQI
jgi:hypothetical protein